MMTTIQVYDPVTRAPATTERRTYGTARGLCIVKNEGFTPWAITHTASGMSVGNYAKLDRARKFMKAIEPLADWTASAAELKRLAKKLCPKLRQAAYALD